MKLVKARVISTCPNFTPFRYKHLAAQKRMYRVLALYLFFSAAPFTLSIKRHLELAHSDVDMKTVDISEFAVEQERKAQSHGVIARRCMPHASLCIFLSRRHLRRNHRRTLVETYLASRGKLVWARTILIGGQRRMLVPRTPRTTVHLGILPIPILHHLHAVDHLRRPLQRHPCRMETMCA